MSLTNQLEYHLIFPITQTFLLDDTLTVSVENMMSRVPTVVYFMIHCLDKDKDIITTYTTDRWTIGSEWEANWDSVVIGEDFSNLETLLFIHDQNNGKLIDWNLNQDVQRDTSYIQLEMVVLGVTSENPLYFNKIMLKEGEYDGYHSPKELVPEFSVSFVNNTYALFLDDDDTYLQVIRPNKNSLTTKVLTASDVTVIAPHLTNESPFDDPINVLYEFMDQREQEIGMEK